MHAVELPARYRQVAGHTRAGRQHDRIEAPPKLLDGDVAADLDPAADLDALGDQLLDASLHDRLLDLEVRHSEAHQPARRLVALEQLHAMASPTQLLGGSHARGP